MKHITLSLQVSRKLQAAMRNLHVGLLRKAVKHTNKRVRAAHVEVSIAESASLAARNQAIQAHVTRTAAIAHRDAVIKLAKDEALQLGVPL